MNYIKLFSLAIVTFFFTSIEAQDIAVANVSQPMTTITAPAAKTVINKKAISELSKFVDQNLDLSASKLNYANSVNVTMEISINKAGELIHVNFVEGSQKLGSEIKEILSEMKEVTPITFNGKASTTTVQIPFVVKM